MEKKRILLEYSKDKFETLQRAKVRVGNPSWNEMVMKAVLEYTSINPQLAQFAKAFEFTEDGYMKIDMARALLNVLDVDEWFFAYSFKDGKRVPAPLWKRLRVQAVFTAFAYHLAHADELPWYWDQTGHWLKDHLVEALKEIGLKWEDIKWVTEMVVTTVWSLYPHLWGKKLASTVGRKVLAELQRKYPQLKVRRATEDEDTRSMRQILGQMEIIHYGMTGHFASIAPPLCIRGVSVVVEWSDETGEKKKCFTFVD